MCLEKSSCDGYSGLRETRQQKPSLTGLEGLCPEGLGRPCSPHCQSRPAASELLRCPSAQASGGISLASGWTADLSQEGIDTHFWEETEGQAGEEVPPEPSQGVESQE